MLSADHKKKMQVARAAQRSGATPDSAGMANDEQAEALRLIRKHQASVVGVFIKAFTGKSKVAGIKAKCLDCSALQKHEVRDCTVRSCPLWLYRPYQTKAK